MKKFSGSLREHTMKIVLKKKKWNYLQTNSKNYIKMQKFAIFVKKSYNIKINILRKNKDKMNI